MQVDIKPGGAKTSRIQVLAVACDESAYFTQWLHHHLYIGFDAIHVMVNRTSDNSLALLQYLSERDTRISYECVDWIDLCADEVRKNMQFVAYAQHIQKLKQGSHFDYFMPLDIDEFWSPCNESGSIHDYLKRHSQADSISFQWLNHFGSPGQFNSLPSKITGRLNKLVKTAYKVSSFGQEVKLHLSLNPAHQQVLCDGDIFIGAEQGSEQLHADLSKARSAMIIHRMFRSPVEYVSLLARGRPSDDLPLKLNRGGYNKAYGESITMAFPLYESNAYQASYLDFINDETLNGLIETGKSYILSRYHRAFESIKKTNHKHLEDIFRVFSGIPANERFTNSVFFMITQANQKGAINFKQVLKLVPQQYPALKQKIEKEIERQQ